MGSRERVLAGIESPASDATDGGAPAVNTLRVSEDGPLILHAPISLAGEPAGDRRALCRCGQSATRPWCDGAHRAHGFRATGEPPEKISQSLSTRDGAVNIRPIRNGPLRVDGAIEMVSATGRTIDRAEQLWLCRCGQSQDKPYCDGSHKRSGFEADGEVR